MAMVVAQWRAALLPTAILLSGPAVAADPSVPPSVAAASARPQSRLAPGYLKAAALPDDLGIFPAPPAAGSSAEARDLEGARAAVAMRGSGRWAQATVDALLFGDRATGVFSCAAGQAIGRDTTPKLDALMRRTVTDFALSTSAIKRRYQRPRPFMVNGEPTCTPDQEKVLRGDGSYPSGHSAIGYGWGLVLAELLPERAGQLVARGRAFGDSRRICNVHWLSDVEEGRVAATVTFARLNADSAFQSDLAAARAELNQPATAPIGCAVEAAALAATR